MSADEIVQRLIEVRDHGYRLPSDLVRMLEEWERQEDGQ